MSDNCCGNCRFFIRHEDATPADPGRSLRFDGRCRRYPPTVHIAKKVEAQSLPMMMTTGWCGEWAFGPGPLAESGK